MNKRDSFLNRFNYSGISFLPFLLLCFFLGLSRQSVQAQMQFNATGTQTINFQNSVPGVNNGAFTGSGMQANPGLGQLDSDGWQFLGWNDGNTSYGGTFTSGDYARGATAVPVIIGGTYAYTGAPGSASNPALMVQPSLNDFTPGSITLRVQNTSAASVLNEIDLSYKLFCNNNEARATKFNLQWSMDNVNYANVPAADYTSPGMADALGWQQVLNPSVVITGFSVVANGYFYIRWSSDDDPSTTSGSRDEFGLDDISVTAKFVSCSSPPSLPATINSISPVTGTSAQVNFTRGNGTGGMMAVVSPVAFVGNPVNGVSYTENTNYGNGSSLGNGYVVYFNNGVTANNSGSFTITGLTPGVTTYYITLFEYNSSGPCYRTPGTTQNFSTPANTNASVTDWFRAKFSGSWANPSNWEFSTDGGVTYSSLPCDRAPDEQSGGIIIPAGITIDINSSIRLDQTTLAGTLRLLSSGKMNLYDGSGDDLDIQNNGVFQVLTNDAYSTTISYPSGTPNIVIRSGGMIRIGAGGSVGSGYSNLATGTSPLETWENNAVFDWNTTETFQTSSQTYFTGTATTDVPIFRISKSPALIPGASSATIWNGVMEINAPLTLRLGGAKYFRNGITGTSVLTTDQTCGHLYLGDQGLTTVSATLSIPTINLGDNSYIYIVKNCTTNLISAVTINHSLGNKGIYVSNGGIFNCGANVVSGTSNFTLASAGTIYSGHAQGITNSGATGNIQVSGARSYSTAANYRYTGTVNQVTGNGLPSTHASLTIANTGSAGNNTVTLTTNNSTSTLLTLTSGLFAIGTGQTYIIPSSGTCAASGGDFAVGTAGGTLNFTSGGNMTGTSNPYNLYVGNGGLNCPASPGKVTIQTGGAFRINSGGWLAGGPGNSIYYSTGSTLEYNSGGPYTSGNEWVQNTTGPGNRGGPSNVSILASGTQLQLSNAGTHIMTGNLLVSTGTQFLLSTNAFSDLTIGGNWTRQAGSGFTHNNRLVNFNGSSDQTITIMGGGVEDFALIRLETSKNNSYLNLAPAPNATGISLAGSSGATNSLEFIRGNIDLNQNTIYFNTNYSNTQTNNIQIDGQNSNRIRNIISTGGPGTISCYNFDNTNSRYLVVSRPGTFGELVLDANVILTTGGSNAGGIDFGVGSLVTINGTFQLNTFGFTMNNPPKYGSGSYLIYNNEGIYRRNVEWQTADPGVPYNVTVKGNNTHVYLNTAMNGTASRTARASLRIFSGAGLSMDGENGNYYGDILTVTDSVYIAGTLELAHTFGGDMYVGKNWKRVSGGVFTDHEREVEFFGSANSNIEGAGGETFSYISINKTGSYFADCKSDINVTRRLRIPSGIFKLDNYDVTLKSTSVYTAYLDVVPSSTSINYSGTGRFVVERFIATGTGGYPNHGKSWQLLSVPVNDAGGPAGQTVNQAWQEGQLPLVAGTPGLGTIITNNVAGTGGFDLVQGVGPSMKTYDPPTNTWVGISGTGIKHYNANGYMIFIRGDRGAQVYNATPTNTTLRTRGKVFAPNNVPASVPVSAGLFQTVGNPYPAPIRFSLLGRSNIGDKFYVWDPRLTTGSAYGLGAYQTFSFDGTNYRVSPGGGSYGAINSICDTIQSGQAFFVQATANAGSVSFSESAKAGGHRLAARTMKPQLNNNELHFLGVRLYVDNQGTDELIDGTVSQFDHQYSNQVDDDDALKLANTGENFSILRNGKSLSVEKMKIPTNGDEIQFNLSGMRVNNYRLEFLPDHLNFSGLKAYLYDGYFNSYTPLSLTDTVSYTFSVNASTPGTYAAGRFKIVFKKGRTVFAEPFLYSLLNGKENLLVCTLQQVQEGGEITLLAIENGKTTRLYQEPSGLAIYQWNIPDEYKNAGFMVKYINHNQPETSNRVKFDHSAILSDFSVYPNPVSRGQFHISYELISGVNANALRFSISDVSGRVLQQGRLHSAYGKIDEIIRLNRSVSAGVYRLTLLNGESRVASGQILVLYP